MTVLDYNFGAVNKATTGKTNNVNKQTLEVGALSRIGKAGTNHKKIPEQIFEQIRKLYLIDIIYRAQRN